MSPSAAVWITDAFVMVFGQQQSSVAERNKTYQAAETHDA